MFVCAVAILSHQAATSCLHLSFLIVVVDKISSSGGQHWVVRMEFSSLDVMHFQYSGKSN